MTEYEKLVLENDRIILHAIHIIYREFGHDDLAHEARSQQQRVIDFLGKGIKT